MCLNRQLLVTVASLSPPLVVEISLNEATPQSLSGCFLNLINEVIQYQKGGTVSVSNLELDTKLD